MKMIGVGLLVLLLIAVVFLVYRFFTEGAKSRSMQPELGLKQGQLIACPNSPNCVSSYAVDEQHGIAPIAGDAEDFQRLVDYLGSAEGSAKGFAVKQRAENYIHATYQSSLFGFVDDIELYFDGSVIQVRSASRVGYSDLGANAKRVEALRQQVAQGS